MGSDGDLMVVGTIRGLKLHTIGSRIAGAVRREVARLELDVERATNSDGTEVDVDNLTGVYFQGPPELVTSFTVGERVQIGASAQMRIATIRRSPLS